MKLSSCRRGAGSPDVSMEASGPPSAPDAQVAASGEMPARKKWVPKKPSV